MGDMNLSQQQYKHAFSFTFLLEMKDENENNKSQRARMFSRYLSIVLVCFLRCIGIFQLHT